MKFEMLYKNLIIEQGEDAPQTNYEDPLSDLSQVQTSQSPQSATSNNKIPTPAGHDDVEPMPRIQAEPYQNKLKEQVARLVKMAQELNDPNANAGTTVQQAIYNLEKGIYKGISNAVSTHITNAAGQLLDAANKLNQFDISTDKRIDDFTANTR